MSRTFVHEQVDTLRVATADGGVVTTTANHPFYVEGRGYVPAGELHTGDVLRGPDGSPVVVESVQGTGRSETVFNLEVEGVHNYHVAADDGTWVLVHNNSCGTSTELARVPDFADDTAAAVHFAKHSLGVHLKKNGTMVGVTADMPQYQHFEEYREAARRFASEWANPGILHGIRSSDGAHIIYHEATNRIAIVEQGVIATYFRLDEAIEYFKGEVQ